MELHTFSSLNSQFLSEYRGTMSTADKAFVYFNPHTIEHKRLSPITPDQVREAFGDQHVEVFTSSDQLTGRLRGMDWSHANLLMMTSGNFDGVDFVKLADELLTDRGS
jgi:UDP-N-acetylmuramate: L-alanyl-gamma-D-glutamyl-meso-diaminopimelate ligase